MKNINTYSAQFKIIPKPMNANEIQFIEKTQNIIKTKQRIYEQHIC